MAHMVDIHTHCTIPTRDDPFGVAELMRGQVVGGNMVSNFRGLPAVGYREMLDFDLQQEVSAKAGITRRLMSSPFMAESVTPYTSKPALERRQIRQ